jgi:hypothetical protein
MVLAIHGSMDYETPIYKNDEKEDEYMDQGQSDEKTRKIKLLQKELIDKRSDKKGDCIHPGRQVEELTRQRS